MTIPPLEPCPFCAAPAILVDFPEDYGYTLPSACGHCNHCGASTARVFESRVFVRGEWRATNDYQAEAAALWNRRAGR